MVGHGEVEAGLMVAGVLGEPRLQFGGVAVGLARLLGERKGRCRALDVGVLQRIVVEPIHQLASVLEIAGTDEATHQSRDRRRLARHLAQNLAVDVRRGGEIAGIQRVLGLLQRLLQRRGAHGSDQPLHEALDLAFRLGAHEAVHRLPLVEGEHGRNRLDAELLRDLRVLVDVDLDQRHLAAGVSHRLLQNRRELLAGAAPGRPEIDDHRRLLRRLDHVGGEALSGRVLWLRRATGRLANEGIHTRMLPAGEDSVGQNLHGSLQRALQACPRPGFARPRAGRDCPARPSRLARGTAAGKRGEERATAGEANGAPCGPYLIMEKMIAGTSGSPAG